MDGERPCLRIGLRRPRELTLTLTLKGKTDGKKLLKQPDRSRTQAGKHEITEMTSSVDQINPIWRRYFGCLRFFLVTESMMFKFSFNLNLIDGKTQSDVSEFFSDRCCFILTLAKIPE